MQTLKIDIAKAYDKLEWDYFDAIMKALGFYFRWINLIMMCIKTVRFHIGVGNEMVDPIVPSRGLHQS